jgi:hypothetical protein
MWTWRQNDGALIREEKVVAFGYSGNGEGKNNPLMQAAVAVGPIPEGEWSITEMIAHYGTHGPFVLRLEPKGDALGRAGFLIHGDSISNPGTASLGCIILPRTIRELVWYSGDRDLRVISGLTQEQQVA